MIEEESANHDEIETQTDETTMDEATATDPHTQG